MIHTDENPLYRALLCTDAIACHYRQAGMLEHRRTPAAAPRSCANELFALNYIDRLLRHRLKEHTRESFAVARQASLQVHRAWIFADVRRKAFSRLTGGESGSTLVVPQLGGRSCRRS